METLLGLYFGLLGWLYFYVKEYDRLTKTSHKFLIQLAGYGLASIAMLHAYSFIFL